MLIDILQIVREFFQPPVLKTLFDLLFYLLVLRVSLFIFNYYAVAMLFALGVFLTIYFLLSISYSYQALIIISFINAVVLVKTLYTLFYSSANPK